ncbi:MAG: RNA polymerase sigma factor [Oscillospiraceae bacterium]|nr:RNA polymerase sigma factor [Oscillospiraceae bacterium]
MDPFEELYRRSSGKVYRYLLSLCGDRALAEELTAETFYRAYLHIDQFEGRCSADTWLCEIGKNAWLKSVRKEKHLLPLKEGAGALQDSPFWQKIEDRDLALQLHKALHSLPEPYREVFSLKVFGELKFSEIAQIFSRSESWAKMTYYRGKRKLAAMLEEETR